MKQKYWYYLIPVLGILFGLWYVRMAFANVIYSDYIRIVDSYLPDVWNVKKFLVPDVLTRIPISYLGRIINTTFFHYSLRFDQGMGVMGLGLTGVVLASYCRETGVGAIWFLGSMVILFSLNKWEMILNGTGWVHFFAVALFFWHFLVLDRIWRGKERPFDRKWNLILPGVAILLVAGPYGASYTVILTIGYLGMGILEYFTVRRKETFSFGEKIMGILSVWIPFGLYLISNHFAVEDHDGAVEGGVIKMLQQFLETPSFFLRFFLKSFSSIIISQETGERLFLTNLPYFLLGTMVLTGYIVAFVLYFSQGLYQKTILPMLLLLSGACNHALVLVARWVFLREDYGISSRYALQFQAGVLGMVLIFGISMCQHKKKPGRYGIEKKHPLLVAVCCGFLMLFVVGNVLSTVRELEIAPYRKELCQKRAAIARNFEQLSDDELRAAFEYRTSRPETGEKIRRVLTVLKENQWNVFYDK